MWVARNPDGNLQIWLLVPSAPKRRYYTNGTVGRWMFGSVDCGYHIPNELFPDLKWEDEPIEVSLVKCETINEKEE